jgi:hypothetical protein
LPQAFSPKEHEILPHGLPDTRDAFHAVELEGLRLQQPPRATVVALAASNHPTMGDTKG